MKLSTLNQEDLQQIQNLLSVDFPHIDTTNYRGYAELIVTRFYLDENFRQIFDYTSEELNKLIYGITQPEIETAIIELVFNKISDINSSENINNSEDLETFNKIWNTCNQLNSIVNIIGNIEEITADGTVGSFTLGDAYIPGLIDIDYIQLLNQIEPVLNKFSFPKPEYTYKKPIMINDKHEELLFATSEFYGLINILDLNPDILSDYYDNIDIELIEELHGSKEIIEAMEKCLELLTLDEIGTIPEVRSFEVNTEATIKKADGDMVIDVTLVDDTVLTYYVNQDVQYIEELGVDAFDKWRGIYDDKVLDLYNDLGGIEHTILDSDEDTEEVIVPTEFPGLTMADINKIPASEIRNYGLIGALLNLVYDNYYRSDDRDTLEELLVKGIDMSKYASLEYSGSRSEYKTIPPALLKQFYNIAKFHNPNLEWVRKYEYVVKQPKAAPQVKIKYVAVDKSTYETDKSGLGFTVEINGKKATGIWRSKSGGYNHDGMDIDELKTGEYSRIKIFNGGGSAKSYEITSSPVLKEKQPKDLRFTGKYYDTAPMGIDFVNKIREGLAGPTKTGATLTPEFLKYFNLNIEL